MTTHAYIYTVGCTLNSRLLSGQLGYVAGTLRGYISPVCYGSVGVQLTCPCSVPGYSYFTMCSEKSEHNCLTNYWYNAAILASFFLFVCLRRCFRLSLLNRKRKKKRNQQKSRLEARKPPTVFITALLMEVL